MTKPQLGPPEIERIITENLTRGQIRAAFGVGEHAAQLARTTAVAIRTERGRAGTARRLDVDVLRKEAEEYIAGRQRLPIAEWIGTDRSKITLFLDWLSERG